MSALSAIRRLHRRHLTVARWATLLLVAIVTFATMPRWMVHAHAGDHAHTTVAVDAATTPIAADGTPTSNPASAHVHYLAGAAFTLPDMTAALATPALTGSDCPPWRGASAPQDPRVPLHRPPIV